MAETDDDALIREINDELRQEQAQKLWQTYGKYVIGVAVAVVVVVASYQGWRAYDRNARQSATDRLIGASTLAQDGKAESAIESLAKLENENLGNIDVLVKLRHAALLAKSGDAQKAADIYAAVANDTSVDASFRDMATVLGSVEMLDVSKDNAEAVISRLQPLTSPNNNWRHSARETIAVAAISLGKLDLAREQLQAIGLDPQAPGGVRSRSQELLQAIGQ